MTDREHSLEEQLEDIKPNFGLGSVLKAKREEYEWAIESVAQALHLSTANIRSLEEDRYDQLPSSTYVIGYWRSYARLLGIDIEETIEANKRNLQVVQPQSTGINVNGGKIHRPDRNKGIGWLVLSAFILAGLAFAWKSGLLDTQKILNITEVEPLSEPVLVEEAEDDSVLRKVEQELTTKLLATDAAEQNTSMVLNNSSTTEAAESITHKLSTETDSQIVESNTEVASIASSAITTSENSEQVETTDGGASEPAEATGTVSTGTQVTPEVNTNLLVMNLQKDSWLDVRDKSNKRLIYRSGKAGESIELIGSPPFYVYIGTPDGVQINYLNKSVPFKAHQSGLFARFKLGEVLENL